jgi:hypothetical protein
MAPSAIYMDQVSESEIESTVIIEAETLDVKPIPYYEPLKPVLAPITTELSSLDSTEPSSACDGFIDTPITSVVEKKRVFDTNRWLPLMDVAPAVNEPMSGAKKLRKMLFETEELIICPGVYDGLSARTAMELGFNAMYMVSIRDSFSCIIQ